METDEQKKMRLVKGLQDAYWLHKRQDGWGYEELADAVGVSNPIVIDAVKHGLIRSKETVETIEKYLSKQQ